jgi:molybdenum cofactor cytidylyltransferase
MTVAIIPAAGKSTRMGRPKLALPLGGRSVLEHVIAALHAGGCLDVLVVVGPHVKELEPLARNAGAQVCLLNEETPEMRATVEAGWRWWESHREMTDRDAWYLVPADHPVLDATIIALLDQERLRHPGRTLFIPTFGGQRGHPSLISWEHVAGMRALPAGVGLNRYLRQHVEQTLEVPVDSPGVLLDLDTPEDYERLLSQFVGDPPRE